MVRDDFMRRLRGPSGESAGFPWWSGDAPSGEPCEPVYGDPLRISYAVAERRLKARFQCLWELVSEFPRSPSAWLGEVEASLLRWVPKSGFGYAGTPV